MASIPLIPRVTRVKLVGYQPLFNRTVDFKIQTNKFLILGGNGLGKTTILQSIIYCLAGEADLMIEEQKNNRWGMAYFRNRFLNPDDAYVEVDFYLGNEKVTIMRGFRTKVILRYSLNDILVSENAKTAETEFEQFLLSEAGYRALTDFRFLVHKLCYLPESRANLVWNSEVQIRLIMLLFSDIIDEQEFRDKRGVMKNFDSRRRHIQVELNKRTKELGEEKRAEGETSSMHLAPPPDGKQVKDENSSLPLVTAPIKNAIDIAASPEIMSTDPRELQVSLVDSLSRLSKRRIEMQQELQDTRKEISVLASQIESWQEQLSRQEEAFILNRLNKLESNEVRMAIHKLLHRHQCPACATVSPELHKKAVAYVDEGRCPLCGTAQIMSDAHQLPLLDAELGELIRARVVLEEKLVQIEQELDITQTEESPLQIQYDRLLVKALEEKSDTLVVFEGKKRPALIQSADKTLAERVEELQVDYATAEGRFIELQKELGETYDDFNNQAYERIEMLARLYQEYATSFLGVPCELESHKADIDFINLNLYVPKFNEKIRPNPNTCSEAQRFFLDIAFRMAMIDLCFHLAGVSGSFICETPENALDVTYMDNVATMFTNFANRGHSFIATGNLQPGALAGPILREYSKSQKTESIFNLLEVGNLSDVQRDHRNILDEQLNIILSMGAS